MEIICSGVEDYSASPDSLKLLDNQGVRQKPLSLCAYGYLECGYASCTLSLRLFLLWRAPVGSRSMISTARCWEALKWEEIVR